MCRRFFEVTLQTYKKYRLSHKAERIYAVAEIKVSLFLDATILVCAAADGTLIPPFVIFRGQRLKLTSAREAYPEAFFTCLYDGKVSDIVLLWWFRDHFMKKIPSSGHRPCVLFLSRAVGDVTFQLSQLAREERVHIISIPPGISHLLQPLDESIARNLENAILKKARKWEEENSATPFTQKVLAQILQKVWRKGINSGEIVSKFVNNGVFPLNQNAISSERIAAASQALKEQQKSPSPLLGSNNSQFSGLSLLSALSSHEYASLDLHGSNDSPNKDLSTIDQDEDYIPDDERTPKSRYGKRKRSDRQAEKERHKQRVSQEIEKIIEEAQSRNFSSTVVTEQSDNAVLASLIEEATKAVNADRQHDTEEEPTIQSELLGAKENFDQINRAIESIGGSVEVEEEQVTTGGHTARLIPHVIATTSRTDTVQSVRLETMGQGTSGIKVFDQDGNEVRVTEAGEIITEDGEVIAEEVIAHQIETAEEIIYKDDEVDLDEAAIMDGRVKEEMIEEEIVQEDFIEEEIYTNEVDIETTQNPHEEVEIISDEKHDGILEVIDQDELTTEPMYVTISDASQIGSNPAYIEAQPVMYMEQDNQPVYVSQSGQTLQLVQQQTSQGQQVRILRQPSIQLVQGGVGSQPRIIKLVQSPGMNSVSVDLAQIQELIQMNSQQQLVTSVPDDSVVMLADDCVQEVVLEWNGHCNGVFRKVNLNSRPFSQRFQMKLKVKETQFIYSILGLCISEYSDVEMEKETQRSNYQMGVHFINKQCIYLSTPGGSCWFLGGCLLVFVS